MNEEERETWGSMVLAVVVVLIGLVAAAFMVWGAVDFVRSFA